MRFDTASVCNGVLAGLVAITAPCDAVEPWAAVCIGIIAGIVYSCFSRLILILNIDDPLEAASVHYINGVWGIIACAIFDNTKGFVSGSPQMGQYLGVQIYGCISITVWSMVCTYVVFLPCIYFGWHKYHPVIELLGAHRFKMGEITGAFLKEIRSFSKKRHDTESSSENYKDYKKDDGAIIEPYESSSGKEGGSSSRSQKAKAKKVPEFKNKVHTETEMVQIFAGGN